MPAADTRHRILVVDDEDLVREVLDLHLFQAGYAVTAVNSCADTLARLETESFDLVLTDHDMPAMTGVELAVVIRTRWPSLPVVMLAGMPPDEPVAALDLILNKPDEFHKLVPSVEELLARPSA